MELPENYTDHEAITALQDRETELNAQLATAYERWENW
jgi:ABC transporter C-terminal domain